MVSSFRFRFVACRSHLAVRVRYWVNYLLIFPPHQWDISNTLAASEEGECRTPFRQEKSCRAHGLGAPELMAWELQSSWPGSSAIPVAVATYTKHSAMQGTYGCRHLYPNTKLLPRNQRIRSLKRAWKRSSIKTTLPMSTNHMRARKSRMARQDIQQVHSEPVTMKIAG